MLVNLETESRELAVDQPDSTNVKQIIDQLANLNDRLRTLEETVITQRNIICKNLDSHNRFKEILKAEREELRAAELRVEAGPPTPVTLKESHVKKDEVKVSMCSISLLKNVIFIYEEVMCNLIVCVCAVKCFNIPLFCEHFLLLMMPLRINITYMLLHSCQSFGFFNQ